MDFSKIQDIYLISSNTNSEKELIGNLQDLLYKSYLVLIQDDKIKQWFYIERYTRKGQKKIIAELIRRIQMNDNCYIGKTADEIMNYFYSKEDKNNKKSKK